MLRYQNVVAIHAQIESALRVESHVQWNGATLCDDSSSNQRSGRGVEAEHEIQIARHNEAAGSVESQLRICPDLRRAW